PSGAFDSLGRAVKEAFRIGRVDEPHHPVEERHPRPAVWGAGALAGGVVIARPTCAGGGAGAPLKRRPRRDSYENRLPLMAASIRASSATRSSISYGFISA